MNNNLHYKIIIAVLIIIVVGLAVLNFKNSQLVLTESLTSYEFVDQARIDETGKLRQQGLHLKFPSNWKIKSGFTNIMISSLDEKASFFLPMNQGQLEGFTPVSAEEIKLGEQTYKQTTYGSGDVKIDFIENFNRGNIIAIGYKYQTETDQKTLQKILNSITPF